MIRKNESQRQNRDLRRSPTCMHSASWTENIDPSHATALKKPSILISCRPAFESLSVQMYSHIYDSTVSHFCPTLHTRIVLVKSPNRITTEFSPSSHKVCNEQKHIHMHISICFVSVLMASKHTMCHADLSGCVDKWSRERGEALWSLKGNIK